MATSFSVFAEMSDRIAATASKLEKQSILAEYFRTLAEADLRLAVRFADGRALGAAGGRTLSVGGAIVSDVLLSLLGMDAREYYALVVRSGEIGEALSKVWPTMPIGSGPLTLTDLAVMFESLARTGVIEQKKGILRELFGRCIRPREAAYVAKIVFGDMRTGVGEGLLLAAVAQAFDRPVAGVRQCQLLVGDLEEIAVLARNGALETARFRLFHPVQFMLATPQESAELAVKTMAGRTFFAEDKLDGIRAQVHKSAEGIAIYTRTMDRADESFPDVVASVARVPGEFVLDGEIVPFCDGRVLPFAHIQKRLGRKKVSARMIRENPAVFIAFDILHQNGQSLLHQPLRCRREALCMLCGDGTLACTSMSAVTTAEQIGAAFDNARARRNEGIVLKDPDSLYSPGRRGQAWLKLKTHLPTFDVVVTAAEHGHGKRRNVLSDYTFAVWDKDPVDSGARLVNVGKAFTGLSDPEIVQLTEEFLKLSTKQVGHVHLVQPKIVLEIACDQIQKSARHASGYALRFPRIKRIRWDKPPEQADRLQRVAEIHQSHHNFAHNPAARPSEREPTLFDSIEGKPGVPSEGTAF